MHLHCSNNHDAEGDRMIKYSIFLYYNLHGPKRIKSSVKYTMELQASCNMWNTNTELIGLGYISPSFANP